MKVEASGTGHDTELALGRNTVSGTAVLAGFFSAFGAVWGLFWGANVLSLIPDLHPDLPDVDPLWQYWFRGIWYLVTGTALGIGALLVFLRRILGRWLIVAGCAMNIGTFVYGSIRLFTDSYPSELARSMTISSTFGISATLTVPAAVTLVLALVPSTGRWLRGKPPWRPLPE